MRGFPQRLARAAARLLAAAALTLVACEGTPHRFDSFPAPMSTRVLVPQGLRDDPEAWACVDRSHDRYLQAWSELIADEADGISRRIRELSNPFTGGSRDDWIKDLAIVQQLARRHASMLARMEALDTGLLSAWNECLGPEWSKRLEAMRIGRSIERWRNVAEASGPAILDLRLMVPGLPLDEAARADLQEAMLAYAERLEPLAKRLAQTRLEGPVEAIRLRQRQIAEKGQADEKAINEAIRARNRKPHDAILQLDLSTIEQLRGSLPEASLDRLREAVIDAADRGRPRYAMELLAPVAVELGPLDAGTRGQIRQVMDAHETADAFLRGQIAEIALRDPEDPRLAPLREQRGELLKALNAKVIELLPKDMRSAMKRMQGDSVAQLRREMDAILDPAVAARLQRMLPEPEPQEVPMRLPVRNGSDVLAQLLPPDFAAWAEIRLPPLAAGDAERADAIRMLVRDTSERWAAELKSSIERLEPLQKEVEAAWREPVTLAETQRRLRLAVAELDAARSRLQLIEDPALVQAAAVAGMPRTDARFERLRLERATEFAGLGWRVLPVQTLFELDREATIDLPTVVEELELAPASRAVADMALVDAAVPLIENAEALRQACVQALRGLVLEVKRAQVQGVPDREMGPVALKAVKSGAATIAIAAEARMRHQRELMTRLGDALPSAEARALRRTYWRVAYPELFVERKPIGATIDRLVESLPPGGSQRAAAEAVLEARDEALDRALPDMIEARRKWPTDALRIGRDTYRQAEREAPVLALALRLRDEIDARALRSLASLHGDDPAVWQAIADWARERPVEWESLPSK